VAHVPVERWDQVNQSNPRRFRIFATSGLLLGLAVVALAVASALTHGSNERTANARFLPATHTQFQPGSGRMGHPGRGFAFGGAGGGTITQISGSTLTLRTEQGTETVNTTSSTQYTKERQTIAFTDLKVGDVVHVVPDASSAKPATPGTGTISASRIVVVEPVLLGRIASIDGDTVNLVGRDGRELTVTLTGSTKYFNGQQSADRSAVAVGSRIVAMGSQDSLTHLTADTVTVLPAGSRAGAAGPMWRGMPGRPGHFGAAGGGGFVPGGFGA
jgi:hypothetical protein